MKTIINYVVYDYKGGIIYEGKNKRTALKNFMENTNSEKIVFRLEDTGNYELLIKK